MEPDDRKVKILKAIIKSYMETGEPVGSRTISKIAGLNLSSATIRNEMSDLEEMGYIMQPHTSAGRIPSDKGYRFYVDEILKEKQLEMDAFKEFMVQKVDRLEVVLQKLAKIIASNTKYATMISGPSIHGNKLKFIQLSAIEKHKLLLVTVLEGNIINNRIIDTGRVVSDKEIFNLNFLLNTGINGLGIDEINLNIIAKLKEDAGISADIAGMVVSEIAEVLSNDNEDFKIYTSGATNIFKYPELSDKEKASRLINAFEEKDKLREIFNEAGAGGASTPGEFHVYIGDELPVQSMQDYSVVTATYEFGQGIRGTIGIVGPKRMDYERVVKTVRAVMSGIKENFDKDG